MALRRLAYYKTILEFWASGTARCKKQILIVSIAAIGIVRKIPSLPGLIEKLRLIAHRLQSIQSPGVRSSRSGRSTAYGTGGSRAGHLQFYDPSICLLATTQGAPHI